MRTQTAFAFTIALLAAGLATAQPPSAPAASPPYAIPANTPANVRRAVQSPDRPAAMTARDFNRKPAEILTLAGIEDGDHVIEIAGFGQYFTTLLVGAVGPTGKVDMYDLPYTERFAGAASRAFDAAHATAVYHQEELQRGGVSTERRRRVQRSLLPRPAAEQDRHGRDNRKFSPR